MLVKYLFYVSDSDPLLRRPQNVTLIHFPTIIWKFSSKLNQNGPIKQFQGGSKWFLAGLKIFEVNQLSYGFLPPAYKSGSKYLSLYFENWLTFLAWKSTVLNRINQIEPDRTRWNENRTSEYRLKWLQNQLLPDRGSYYVKMKNGDAKKTSEYVIFKFRKTWNGTASLVQWEMHHRNDPDLLRVTLVRIYRLSSKTNSFKLDFWDRSKRVLDGYWTGY